LSSGSRFFISLFFYRSLLGRLGVFLILFRLFLELFGLLCRLLGSRIFLLLILLRCNF
jgi:hypothetical protein